MNTCMKVEIIANRNEWQLQKEINEFIKTHNVTDIQYQMSGNPYRGEAHSAMIVYEEEVEG